MVEELQPDDEGIIDTIATKIAYDMEDKALRQLVGAEIANNPGKDEVAMVIRCYLEEIRESLDSYMDEYYDDEGVVRMIRGHLTELQVVGWGAMSRCQ